MTENKRFKLHIKWFNPAKTNGEATLTDNGQPLLTSERIEEMRWIKDLLNELNEEIDSKQRVIDVYEDYIKTLKEDGVLE